MGDEMNEVIEMEGSSVRDVAQHESGGRAVSATPADLFLHALNSGADLDRLERLMVMQERWEANQARKAYVEAMAEFKKNPPEIFKDKTVSFKTDKGNTTYDHATIGNVVEKIVGGLAKHGFSHRWIPNRSEGGMISITCVITHKLGHSEETTLEAGLDQSGGKNNIQAMISTKTYLERHSLLAATGLATKDNEDDDGRGFGEVKQEKQTARSPLSGKAFDRALASIREGTYTAAEIESWYALTEDQKIAAMDAEKERK